MKFSIFFVVLAALAAQTQAKFLMGSSVQIPAFTQNEIGEEPMMQAAMQTEQLYIPMRRNVGCNNSACNGLCQALGYKHGICVSENTCECYN